ncbi:putative retrotransposon hot spot protein (RHS) [Trypanosoma vivax]|nr:putative retrotransposon hot spot protein (RHS) [Trypanosoma vivax]
MAGRKRLVRQNAGGGAGEPPLARARLESVPRPRWTLDSRVKDVLLDGVSPPNEVPLSECLERVGCDGGVANVDVNMDVVIHRPEQFIRDADLREMILSLHECQTYALVDRAVPLLEGKGIAGLRQWGDAINAAVKNEVRDALSDEGLWNKTRGLLDAALNAVKDAEAREKERKRERERSIAKVIEVEGLYDSVVNATWACVRSGVAGKPLDMKIYQGHVLKKVIGPGMLWEEKEVNFFNTTDNEADEQCDREDGIEIFVLTSRMGWPFMVYRGDEQASTTLPKEFYCGVFVRREVVRVWYLVKKYLDVMHGEATGKTTHRLTLIGSPGIGKSFSVGSFLLYMLLHYDANRLHIVAWFIGGLVYVFLKNEQPGKVLKFYDQMEAEAYIEEQVATGLRVYVIYDVGGSRIGPEPNWRLNWPGILISPPNKANYRGWLKTDGTKAIYINCHHVREIKAIHVWTERLLRPNSTVSKVEDRWYELSERIDVVGPLLRYVLYEENYNPREKEIRREILQLNDDVTELCKKLLHREEAWCASKLSPKIMKLVRVHYDGLDEDCRNKGVSVNVYKGLMRRVMYEEVNAGGVEQLLRTMGFK